MPASCTHQMEGSTACSSSEKQHLLPKHSAGSIHGTECPNAVSRSISTSSSDSIHQVQPSRDSGKDQVLVLKDHKQQSNTSSSRAASPSDSASLDIKPSPAEAPATGKKRAFLCGVTYSAGENSLIGSVNDVNGIREMLIEHFGYPDECIRVLREDQDQINGNELSTTPTKKNIEDSLKWLVEGSESGDSLVFFFSGHCEQQRRPDHSETHHVCLVDCTGKGMIPNYDINFTIVRPLKKGVSLYAIVDACYSGSILDLNYTNDQQSNDKDKGRWMDLSKAEKGTSGGLAICLSACGDDETAPETINANSSGKGTAKTMGAMTYHLIQNIVTSKHPENVTYEYILKIMHDLRVTNERVVVPFDEINPTSKFLQAVSKSRM